jgi:inner membrane protein
MDPFTHSLVGLTSAKTGLERLSPYAIPVCLLAANAPDVDVIAAVGGRWAALHYHRGITHSMVGTIAFGILIPSIFCLIDRLAARIRRRAAQARYGGLLVASLIASATHPLMDWTNNYGIRLLLPWNARWFYGDLVFIIDPYIWLVVGGALFLLTSNTRAKLIVWSIIGALTTFFILAASSGAVRGGGTLRPARVIWVAGLAVIVITRVMKVDKPRSRRVAIASLIFVVLYWTALAWQHRIAYGRGVETARQIATERGERFIRSAAMPVAANPFRWLNVAETDAAMYRFVVSSAWDVPAADSRLALERFEKPTGRNQELVARASQDPRARILLEFARFPFERLEDADCVSQTLVEFADLRYTEPQPRARGNFALTVPVECDSR